MAGTTGVGARVGARARSEDSLERWLSEANNYAGVVDRTGRSTVEIAVGVGAEDLAFGPAAIRVSPGTTVRWHWKSDGHTVTAENTDFEAYDTEPQDADHTFERTFDVDGISMYYCAPHESLGMKGAVIVGESAAQTTPTPSNEPVLDGWFKEEKSRPYVVDRTDRDTATVAVGAGTDGLRFDPELVLVQPGTTIEWQFESNGHRVVPHSQPPGANWDGQSGEKLHGDGDSFSATFDVRGVYKYSCEPHEGFARGALIVADREFVERAPDLQFEPDWMTWVRATEDFHGGVTDWTDKDAPSISVGSRERPLAFDPPVVRITPGTTVTWRWDEHDATHDVAATDGTFDSDSLLDDENGVYSYTFDETGVYRYVCKSHREEMRGVVLVGDPTDSQSGGRAAGDGATEELPERSPLQFVVAATVSLLLIVSVSLLWITRTGEDNT